VKVKANVYVIKDGQTVLLRPGDTVPDGVTVTNPDVIDADAVILPAPEAPEAPESTEDEAEAEKPAEEAEAPEAPADEPAPARKRTARKAADSE